MDGVYLCTCLSCPRLNLLCLPRAKLKVLVGVAVNHISTECVLHRHTVVQCPCPPVLTGVIPR